MCYDEHKHVSLTWSRLILAGLIVFYVSDYIPLTNLIGIYYQIRDDYMNLQSNQVL